MNETNRTPRTTAYDTIMLGNCPRCNLWEEVQMYINRDDVITIRCNSCGRTVSGDDTTYEIVEAWNRAE